MPSGKLHFPIDSSQCELLVHFHDTQSLGELARVMGRDLSAISRQLQKLADTAPVLEKIQGRWCLTELGKRMVVWARSAMLSQQTILKTYASRLVPGEFSFDKAALLLIGVQTGFDRASWGARNNPRAEENIDRLLAQWRLHERPVIHIQHVSRLPGSPFFDGSVGSEFKSFAKPRFDEIVLRKIHDSGFVGTTLETDLRAMGVEQLVLCGFTVSKCVDATARSAAELGFDVRVVSDATVAFDRASPGGKTIPAAQIHEAVMATLHDDFGIVIKTSDAGA